MVIEFLVALLFVLMMAVGAVFYVARRHVLRKRGFELDDILKKNSVLAASE